MPSDVLRIDIQTVLRFWRFLAWVAEHCELEVGLGGEGAGGCEGGGVGLEVGL